MNKRVAAVYIYEVIRYVVVSGSFFCFAAFLSWRRYYLAS